ncbi:hypothetical protein [Amycolatopsis thermoflava]|uniref:hypothetical protein n=1 Tax=Amycolatopsis thermoflava TaxID=84480 RepID=UPI003EBC9F63
MLAQAAQQPGIPFWLQITTITLAPILGFAGVAVGVLLKDRSDHKASLRAERRAAYTGFLRALNALHRCFVVKGGAAFKSGLEKSISAYEEEMYRLRLELDGARYDVALVGSSEVVAAAERVSAVAVDIDIAETVARRSGYRQEAWNKALLRCLHVASTFQVAAVKDLRLRPKDRMRSSAEFFAKNETLLLETLPGWRGDERSAGEAGQR